MGRLKVFGINSTMDFEKKIISKTSFFKNILIIYAITLVAFTTPLSHEPMALYIAFLMLFLVCFVKYRIKINISVYFVIGIWLTINVFASYLLDTSFSLNQCLGYLVPIMISFFIMKIIGNEFWVKFENMIFKFTLISTIIYLLDLLILDPLFYKMTSLFQPITADIYIKRYPFYWTSIIYTHSYTSNTTTELVPFRNSGFMWEPGAFAMIISIAILYNYFSNGFLLNKKIVIYAIILLGTFSTAGYISFAIILMLYLVHEKKFFISAIITLILLLSLPIILEQDFLAPKIDSYLAQNEQSTSASANEFGIIEVNRYTAFLIKVFQWSQYPAGYGVVSDSKIKGLRNIIDGVNGIGDILYRWGLIGIIFFMVSLSKYFSFISKDPPGILISSLAILSVLVVFFSNPIQLNPIVFFIVFTPYILKDNNRIYAT